ncbi:MAG: anti-sigma factor family protein [Bryobacteraceae bacterium]
MHEPLVENLEEYLHGGVTLPHVEEHLSNCPSCRKELDEMRKQTAFFETLRPAREFDSDPGFYARVMARVEAQGKPSAWSLFGDSLFAKRLSYACATLLLLLGSVFLSASNEEQIVTAPEAFMAADDKGMSVGTDPQRDREAILVNLTSYQE